MSIAEKLSWEFVALSDRGSANEDERLALEIASGVANLIGDQPDLFSAIMSSIVEQVSDQDMKRLLRNVTARGLRK